MEIQQIPIHPKLESAFNPDVEALRRNAPSHLVALIEDGKLENIDSLADIPPSQLSILGGGELSVAYSLLNNEKPTIIKLRTTGGVAEATALTQWKQQGAQVVRVLESGVLPAKGFVTKPVEYVLLEGITTDDGSLAPDGYAFTRNNPNTLEPIGTKMGLELAKMHRAKTSEEYGSLDTPSKSTTTPNEYYLKTITPYIDYLEKNNFSPEEIQALLDAIKTTHFPSEGTYIHGDFGIHNILFPSAQVDDLQIIDPNPKILDPYWDLAWQINRRDLKQAKHRTYPDDKEYEKAAERETAYCDALIASYKAESGENFDERRMLVNQIVLDIPSIPRGEERIIHERGGTANQAKKTDKIRELQIRKSLLKNRVNKLISMQAA